MRTSTSRTCARSSSPTSGWSPSSSIPSSATSAPSRRSATGRTTFRETRFTSLTKSVHVQAAIGIEDPVEETKWLQAFADRLGHPHGIVGEVHLAQPDAAEVIERHMANANFRGVRDFGQGDYPSDPAWRAGFANLEKRDLVACLDSSPETYASVKSLAEAFPDTVISLDHAGFPRRRDQGISRCGRRSSPTGRGSQRGHQGLRPACDND
jgi:predicted TIM-barrel fold metal-dependent hydrolase